MQAHRTQATHDQAPPSGEPEQSIHSEEPPADANPASACPFAGDSAVTPAPAPAPAPTSITPPKLRGGLPWFGHFGHVFGFHDPRPFFLRAYKEHGPVFAIKSLGVPHAVLLGPKAQQLVLARDTNKMSWRGAYSEAGQRVLGRSSLPIIDGEAHRVRRQPMMGALRKQRLGRYVPAMVELTRQQSENWANGRPFELVSEMSELTFRIGSDVLLGVKIGAEYEQFKGFYQRIFSVPGLALTMLNLPAPSLVRAKAGLNRQAGRWLTARRADPSTDDMLSALIGAGFDDDDIICQMLILMFAGHDTTKLMLAWTLTLLLQHPEYLARVMQEQEDVLGDGPITDVGVRRLPLLDRALREANRLYPPAGILKRGVEADFEFGGHLIPKGWKVLYLPSVSHYLPDVFADPFRFDPDRFAPPRNEHKQPYALVDFGGGYRICIGKDLSLLEARVVLSYLLRTYTFTLCDRPRVKPSYLAMMTRPRRGMRLQAVATGRVVPGA